MQLSDYQEGIKEFRLPSATEEYVAFGFIGEIGELYSKVAKSIRDGKMYEQEEIHAELGDILWFIAALATDLGANLNTVATNNLAKLASRKERNTIQGSGDDR